MDEEATKDQNRAFANLTAGQLVAGCDKMYSDYRNLRMELSGAVLGMLRSIESMSDDEIEKSLQNMRKAAAGWSPTQLHYRKPGNGPIKRFDTNSR